MADQAAPLDVWVPGDTLQVAKHPLNALAMVYTRFKFTNCTLSVRCLGPGHQVTSPPTTPNQPTHSTPTHTMACGGCAAAAVPSGSEAYAKLYPAKSSDNVLRLGNIVPGGLASWSAVVCPVLHPDAC